MAYTNTKKAVKKKKQRSRLLVSFLVLCLILTVLFFIIMRMSFLQVESIGIEGNTFAGTDGLQQAVSHELKGKHMFYVPNSNILFLPKDAIITGVMNSFTQVESATIDRKGLKHMTLQVTERDELYVYCNTESICFSLDAQGLVFKSLETGSEREDGVTYTSKNDYKVGETYIRGALLQELSVLLSSIEGKGLEIIRVHELSEFMLALYTKQGTRILLPITNSYDETYSTFVKLLTTQEFALNKEERDFKQKYAYINMQFGNKIFSCLVGEECENNYR